VDEDVGDEHGHGAVGEVDHASAAVLEDESLAEDGVGGAGAEPEDQEEEVAGHGVSGVWSGRVAAAGPGLLAPGDETLTPPKPSRRARPRCQPLRPGKYPFEVTQSVEFGWVIAVFWIW